MPPMTISPGLAPKLNILYDRLPEKYKGSGPQIIATAEGNHAWKYEGQLFPYIGVNAVAGRRRC